MAYPVDFQVEYGDGKRSRGLALLALLYPLKILLLIPHLIVVVVLSIVSGLATYIGYWVTAFTGKLPSGFFKLIKNVMDWSNRTTAWLLGLTDEYPPFAMEAPDYPARLTVEEPESNSRGLAVLGILYYLKVLALLPHLIVLLFVAIAFFVVWIISIFAILFTGSLPKGMFDFMAGFTRWNARVNAWLAGLVDEYPPFSLT